MAVLIDTSVLGRLANQADAAHPLHPTAVEQDFAFYLGDTRVVGRYDLVVEEAGRVTLLDFKTGHIDDPEKADERARTSVQLDLYALAHLKTRLDESSSRSRPARIMKSVT